MKNYKQLLELEDFLIETDKNIPDKAEEYGDYYWRMAKSLFDKYDIKEK